SIVTDHRNQHPTGSMITVFISIESRLSGDQDTKIRSQAAFPNEIGLRSPSFFFIFLANAPAAFSVLLEAPPGRF
ncbi:hypothetical protein, partial [Proteus vulgaris]|uniref:hypothetical protein n=1 Tax=Proteus vulgaris TaxID=585 RepID=UPI0019538FE2